MNGTAADKRAIAARGYELPRMWEDNVLVLMDWLADAREDRKTASGLLYVPHSARKPANDAAVEATVLAAAPGFWEESHIEKRGRDGVHVKRKSHWRESSVKVGDRVLVDRADQGDVFILDDGREARIVRHHNLVGVIEEEDAAE